MLSAIQIKLLAAIVVLLTGLGSYLAWECHSRQLEELKNQKAFERMKTEKPQAWGTTLKDAK